ncbi:chorion protein S38 [Stomoxys calcitrans]|uniref:Uncharacterized protein n=1 Tax=Stomoxys calcitrans TaxID=35570 RepID=A0A1I8Q732_STOCA|nr:chorion protein S38 [Stomoxys calcitrans]XP_013108457.1 chorion protein S38 [Stomoxys calcitrans]
MKFFVATLSIALIAMATASGYNAPSNYGQQAAVADTGAAAAAGGNAGNFHHGLGNAADAGASGAAAAADTANTANVAASTYGSNNNLPYAPQNSRGNSISSSITYPNNKGEILIHRPAAIIVKRPPTKVVVNHPPLVVKPAPVVMHKPPAVVLRKVVVKHHPRPVKVEPVYVNVVKPPAEKYFVNEKQQQYTANPAAFAPVNLAPGSFAPAAAGNGAAAAAGNGAAAATADNAHHNGYQLLPGSGNLAALAHLPGYGAHHGANYGANYGSPAYGAPSY